MLRISDVLIRNLVHAAIAADCHITRNTTIHLDMLLDNIRKCGITFRIKHFFPIHYDIPIDMEIKRNKRASMDITKRK